MYLPLIDLHCLDDKSVLPHGMSRDVVRNVNMTSLFFSQNGFSRPQ